MGGAVTVTVTAGGVTAVVVEAGAALVSDPTGVAGSELQPASSAAATTGSDNVHIFMR